MKKLMLCFTFLLMISFSYAQLPVIDGLITHLDETGLIAESNGVIVRWDDLSGNNADMLPVSGADTVPAVISTSTSAILPFNNHVRSRLGAAGWDPPAAANMAHCEVAELIVYGRELSDVERNSVGYYLEKKYSFGSAYTDPGAGCTLTVNIKPASIMGDTVTPAVGAYKYLNDETVEIEALPHYVDCPDVYDFSHWTVDGTDVYSSVTTFLMDVDKTVTANYKDIRECGDLCHPILTGDFDGDCEVTLTDFAVFAKNWLLNKSPNPPRKAGLQQESLFVNNGSNFYRIPSLVVTKNNTVLAFCNRRVGSIDDYTPEHNLILQRSLDGGQTWQPVQELCTLTGWACPIGSAVLDENTGKILVTYTRNPATEEAIQQNTVQNLPTGYFIASSTDDGMTWSHQYLNVTANSSGKIGHCHGSAPGITLQSGQRNGRLVMPAKTGTELQGVSSEEFLEDLQTTHYNCAIYSDDHGLTWQTSEPVQVGTGEGCLAEMSDGTIYYNSRAYFLDYKRRIAYSYDSSETFKNFSFDETLLEPVYGCNAGLVRYPFKRADGKNIFIFSNPANHLVIRTEMTIKISYDEGKTWPVSRIIHDGYAAYSALAVSQNGTIYCLYECGESEIEEIKIARFNIEWVSGK